jgi:hypothetical protein
VECSSHSCLGTHARPHARALPLPRQSTSLRPGRWRQPFMGGRRPRLVRGAWRRCSSTRPSSSLTTGTSRFGVHRRRFQVQHAMQRRQAGGGGWRASRAPCLRGTWPLLMASHRCLFLLPLPSLSPSTTRRRPSTPVLADSAALCIRKAALCTAQLHQVVGWAPCSC